MLYPTALYISLAHIFVATQTRSTCILLPQTTLMVKQHLLFIVLLCIIHKIKSQCKQSFVLAILTLLPHCIL